MDASLPLSTPIGIEGAAVRDAQNIAARIAEDEAAAAEAREFYQVNGLPTIEADAGAGALLHDGEALHAIHASALLEEAPLLDEVAQPRGGTLYLTSQRLVHTATEATELPLLDIEEMAVALERLVLIRRRNGSDLALEVDQPRLLRVQLAAAIAAERARRTSQP
jgi:hypothetical protein